MRIPYGEVISSVYINNIIRHRSTDTKRILLQMLAKYAYALIVLAKNGYIHGDPHNDNYIQIEDRKASAASDSDSSSDSSSDSASASDSDSASGSASVSASAPKGSMIDLGKAEEVPKFSHRQILENISAFDRAIKSKNNELMMQSLIKMVNHIHLLNVDMMKRDSGYNDLSDERKAQIDKDIKEYYGWFTDQIIVEGMLPYIIDEHVLYKLKEAEVRAAARAARAREVEAAREEAAAREVEEAREAAAREAAAREAAAAARAREAEEAAARAREAPVREAPVEADMLIEAEARASAVKRSIGTNNTTLDAETNNAETKKHNANKGGKSRKRKGKSRKRKSRKPIRQTRKRFRRKSHKRIYSKYKTNI